MNTKDTLPLKPGRTDRCVAQGPVWGICRLKALMGARPVLGTAARSLTRIPVVKELLALRHRFRDSSSYWERRYRQGGTSGSGSVGRLAEFKADILNGFVARMGIQAV